MAPIILYIIVDRVSISAINHTVLVPLKRNFKRKTHGLNVTVVRLDQLAFRRIFKKYKGEGRGGVGDRGCSLPPLVFFLANLFKKIVYFAVNLVKII